MPINPGQLDRRLTIQALTSTRGKAGGHREAWVDVRTVWGSKVDQGGSEFVAAGVLQVETTTLFRIRWWADLTDKHRIVCDGKLYEIVLINEIGRRELMQIQARGRKAP